MKTNINDIKRLVIYGQHSKLSKIVGRKGKVLIEWNDGRQDRKSMKRVWQNKYGFFFRDSSGQRIYIEDQLLPLRSAPGEFAKAVWVWRECDYQPELLNPVPADYKP